jgi:hypothetical protein
MGIRNVRIGVLVLALLSATVVAVQAADQDRMKDVADSVMDDIASRITAAKGRYMVFANFDPASLTRNAYGFKELRYAYSLAEERNLEVNVIILPIKASKEEGLPEGRVLEFPLAGVKVVWSTVNGGFYLEGFDLGSLVEDATWPLEEVQQQQLPIRMSIETPKTNYLVGEAVELDIVVKNVTSNNIRVKPLNSQTAYCVLNTQEWGTKDPKPAPSKKILGPGEELRAKMRMQGIQKPGDFRIICSYGIGFQKVRPEARKVLKVEKDTIKDN